MPFRVTNSDLPPRPYRASAFRTAPMQDVDYAVIAVRNDYRDSDDFDKVCRFLETIYASGRLVLPLKGVLIIGY